MARYDVKSYQRSPGRRPLPCRPEFPVWAADLDHELRVLETWELARDNRPEAEVSPLNPLWRISLRQSSLRRDGLAWVTTIPKLPAIRPPGSRIRVGPTELAEASFRALEAIEPDIDGIDFELGFAVADPDGPWRESEIIAAGTNVPTRMLSGTEYWVAAAEIEGVYVGVAALDLAPEDVRLVTCESIPA